MFKSIANPDRPPEESARFTTAYAAMLGLSAGELATLRASAEQFRGALVQMRSKSAATYSSARSFHGGELDSSDQHTLNSLDASFRERVEELGEQFLQNITPGSAIRIRTVFGGPIAELGERSSVSAAGAMSSDLMNGPSRPRTSLTLAQWEDCIQGNTGGYGSTCTLASGTYNVSATIPVWRSNITINGASGGTTTLTRVSPWPTVMVQVGDGSHTGVTDVTFSDLTFNGNSENMAAGSYNTSPNYVDLDLGVYATWNTYVSNCTFDNSPAISIFTVYYSYINSSWFYFNTNPSYAGYTALLTWNSSSQSQSTDIQFTNSTVQYSGLNGVFFEGSERMLVQYDYFYHNHQTCFANAPGGQIAVGNNVPAGMYSNDADIWNNYVDGEDSVCSNGWASRGLEMYGTDYSIENNTFINHKDDGVIIGNASDVLIESNTIEYNEEGIELYGNITGSGCAPTPGDGIMYTISSNTIEHNTLQALEGRSNGCANGPFQSPEPDSSPTIWNVTLTGNTLSGNGNNSPYFHTGN